MSPGSLQDPLFIVSALSLLEATPLLCARTEEFTLCVAAHRLKVNAL